MPVGAIATKGVLGDVRAAGYRERRGMADGGAIKCLLIYSYLEKQVNFAPVSKRLQGYTLFALGVH